MQAAPIQNLTQLDSQKAVLTDLSVKSARPDEKAYKLFDEKGLYLLVAPTGARLWRFKYFVAGREKLVSLGRYPDVTLKLAPDRRDEARRQVAAKVDPEAERKAARIELSNTASVTQDASQRHRGSHSQSSGRLGLSADCLSGDR